YLSSVPRAWGASARERVAGAQKSLYCLLRARRPEKTPQHLTARATPLPSEMSKGSQIIRAHLERKHRPLGVGRRSHFVLPYDAGARRAQALLRDRGAT